LATDVAIALDYILIIFLEPCNKLDDLLNKAISNSKTALASNELQEALDYFKKGEKIYIWR
jgi:hypothetical protein